MNTSNQNHDPTQSDDVPDRLVDLALSELIGGSAPPDLSSRIAAATFRQTAAVAQVPRTRQQDRAFWVHLAIAVMLLIGVTTVLLPQWSSSRRLSRVAMKESAKQDQLSRTDLQSHELSSMPRPSQATTKPAQPNSLAPKQLEKLTQFTVQPPGLAVAERLYEGDGKELRTSNLDRDASGPQSASEAQAQPTIRPAGPAGGSPLKDFYGPKEIAPGPEGQPAVDVFGVNTTAPNQKSGRAWRIKTVEAGVPRAGLEMGDQVATKSGRMRESENMGLDGLINDSLAANGRRDDVLREIDAPAIVAEGIGQNLSGDKYGLDVTPAPTTTQLVDEIHELQRQGKPTEKQKKELARRMEKSVDLGALTAEGAGPGQSGDKYTRIVENPFIKAEGGAAVSTLSIDVDTASYANVRQFLLQMNQLPPPDAVRIEELVNYFQYNYEAPKQSDEAPFAAHVEVTGCPWAPEHRLARIGIKGREMDRNKRPQSNLVFLVDVSGSMNEPAKLPLVLYGLEQLTRELGENDHIAIVVYAGTEGVVLPSTSGSKQDTILAALAKLQAGGSTAGGAGIQLAYQIAEDNFIKGGTNRVILCTDGDFNVGVTNTADLQRLVEKKAKDTGVFLSTLGFGRGNLNDAMMVAISDHGNGNYHYIDNRTEARRVLVQEMTGTLVTIAKDVKIQVEFNPAQVAGYRLIGYEKRMLRTEDFNDDKKDAGEIGAGHTVTALYEIIPAGKKVEVALVDDLKYQKLSRDAAAQRVRELLDPKAQGNELLTLKMRYKAPDGDTSKKLEWPVTDDGKSFSAASGDLKFAASVAGFGLLLRDSQFKGNLTYAADIELAQGGIGEDPHGYRKEFLDMVRKAKELRHE